MNGLVNDIVQGQPIKKTISRVFLNLSSGPYDKPQDGTHTELER